jgi:CelD/BcsL family acetyltransferase involved in cellulose biosynthesis
LKRKRRRAEQIGPVRSETLAPTPDEARILLDAVMQVEASGWKGRSGSAMRFNRRVGAFFRRYAPLAAANGHLRVSLLHVGSHLAAADLSLEADRRLWQLKIGYDESLARCSPGLLLTHDTLAYAFSHRLEAFEFLGSAEAWQERWGAVPRQYASILGYPLTPRGLWGLTVDGVGRTIERLRAKRLRRAVRESAGATT